MSGDQARPALVDEITVTACGVNWDAMNPETRESFARMIRLAAEQFPKTAPPAGKAAIGLTAAEAGILNALGDVWNAFAQLPVDHPWAATEFMHGIHRLQEAIAARPALRILAVAAPPPSGGES